jgi:phosphoserine phosphatase
MMITAPERRTVYFDVDSTLVFAQGEYPQERTSALVVYIAGRCWLVHEPHLSCLRDFAARGHNIILWSAGGPAWASAVAEALGVSHLVFACLPKPDWFFDDKPVEKWLTPLQRTYLRA